VGCPAQRVELFGTILHHATTYNAVICIEIFGPKFEEVLGIVQVKYRGDEKLAFFWQISPFISKTVQDTAIVTMEDE